MEAYFFISSKLGSNSRTLSDSMLFLMTAHYQVPSGGQSQQEAGHRSKGHGQVSTVPDSGWNPIPALQLGPPQRLGKFIL
jgi:hypothetical protein